MTQKSVKDPQDEIHPGQGCLGMDVVTEHGAPFREKADGRWSALMFDVTITNPLDPIALAQAGT